MQCVAAKETTCLYPATGNAASLLARAVLLPCEPTRRNRNETIRAVLISSISKVSPLRLMSSPNHFACSDASAWQ